MLIAAASPLGGLAQAQFALPGASSPGPAAVDKPARKPRSARKSLRTKVATPGFESIVDKDLLLNGANGELRLSADEDGKTLRIDKFALPGEVISDPRQKCRIEIVAQTPIEAVSQGEEPDGLRRYTADIPACPLTFDVLGGAVRVPAQTTACVFQAADCQASPSGIWGPDPASLEKETKALTRERLIADASMATSLRVLEKRDKSAAAALTSEQTDFAAERDDACHDYAGEAQHGFCSTRLTQARALLLRMRASAARHKKKAADVEN